MTHTLNGKEILAVKVPDDATNFWINNIGCIRYSQMQGKISSVIEPAQIGEYLEKDKWSILGRGRDLTEEQWRGLVGGPPYASYEEQNICAEDYKGLWVQTATASGLSWLKANGIDENYLLIIKN